MGPAAGAADPLDEMVEGVRDRIGRTWPAVGFVALVGAAAIAWLTIWSTTSNRAGYDTLWYSKIAMADAGLPLDAQYAESWAIFTRYADSNVIAAVGDPQRWHRPCLTAADRRDATWPPCVTRRWLGVYEQRPVFPLAVAAARPLLGQDAVLGASFLAVVGFTVAILAGLPGVAGYMTAALTLLISLLNPALSPWLVHLATDGLGIALWTSALICGVRFAMGGSRWWLTALVVTSLVLAFTRPLGLALPLTFGVSAVAAKLVRSPSWRGLLIAAAATVPALAVFSMYSWLAGYPSFLAQLQDLPTGHFREPDVPDLMASLVWLNERHLPRVFAGWLGQPLLVVMTFAGALGFLVKRAVWTIPFAAAIGTASLLQVFHPVSEAAPRALAPAWVSLDLGIALLATVALQFARARVAGGGRSPSMAGRTSEPAR